MTNHAVISHSIVTNIELITLIGNLNSSAKMDFVFVAPTKLLSTHLRFNGWISENPIVWKNSKCSVFQDAMSYSCWGMMENWVITRGPGHWSGRGPGDGHYPGRGRAQGAQTLATQTSQIVWWRKIMRCFEAQVVIIIRFELSAFEFLFIYPTHYPRSIDSCTLDRGRFVR